MKLASAAAAIRAAFQSAQGEIDKVRTSLGELTAERQHIESAPRDRAEVEATVDRLIAEAAAKEAFELPALWSPHTRPFEAVNRFNQMALGWSAPNGAFVPGDMFATLACWDAPKLKRLIMANAPADGLTDEGRAKALARIDGKILALEVEEERLCRALEAETGVATLRREDANLAIMLAPDVELEAA